jgi:hypothetical protein
MFISKNKFHYWLKTLLRILEEFRNLIELIWNKFAKDWNKSDFRKRKRKWKKNKEKKKGRGETIRPRSRIGPWLSKAPIPKGYPLPLSFNIDRWGPPIRSSPSSGQDPWACRTLSWPSIDAIPRTTLPPPARHPRYKTPHLRLSLSFLVFFLSPARDDPEPNPLSAVRNFGENSQRLLTSSSSPALPLRSPRRAAHPRRNATSSIASQTSHRPAPGHPCRTSPR